MGILQKYKSQWIDFYISEGTIVLNESQWKPQATPYEALTRLAFTDFVSNGNKSVVQDPGIPCTSRLFQQCHAIR
jgi:hypothetical protein